MKAAKQKDIKDKMPKLEWILYPFIPKNHISILAGPGGGGKSSIALYFSISLLQQGRNVLYIDAEQCGDEINDRVERWKIQHLGELYLSCTDNEEGYDDSETQTISPSDEKGLEKLIKSCSPELVIIDSLTAYCDTDLTARHKASQLLKVFKRLASRYKTGILILCHTNKDNPAYINGVDSIAGNKGISDLARSVLMLSVINNEGRRKIIQEKANSVDLSGSNNVPFLFTLAADGILDAGFDKDYCEAREMFATEYDSGVKAERFRKKALELIRNKKEKTEIIATLKELGASGTECTRAIKAAIEHISK